MSAYGSDGSGEELMTFQEELTVLINKHCIDNVSNTPDYILASFMGQCLLAFNGCTVARDRWHGFDAEKSFSL